MIFASTPPINDDPAPYDNVAGDVDPDTVPDGKGWAYAPRPEFDRPRAHEANSILLASREYAARKDVVPSSVPQYYLFGIEAFEVLGGFREWERETHPFHSLTRATADEIDHAKRVLKRVLGVSA